MEGIAAEVSLKLKSAIKAKLMELGAYVDEELPNYVMVMVTNKRSKSEMDRELNLFLGGNTSTFTTWLQSVWTKLEQVTVANIGLDKKKLTDKKKKVKKSKSSSESEDDRKHKKKRKSSTTNEFSMKENKKRKTKGESETENDFLPKDEDIANKKTKVTKNDVDDDLSNDTEEIHVSKKPGKESSLLDEDDFLNIKEDFESEFLSDEEVDVKMRKVNAENRKSLNKADKIGEPTDKKLFLEKYKKEETDKINDKSKDKENKVDNVDIRENEVPPKTSKTVLIRNRKVVKSRSRSRSPVKNEARNIGSGSAPRSKSRSISPLSNNIIKLREKSPILDARELINRKRALQNSIQDRLSKDDKIPIKRPLLLKKADDDFHFRDSTEKENDLREKLPDKYQSFVMNKTDGKRGVIIAKEFNEDSFPVTTKVKNDKIDLRKIKRTVYVSKNDESGIEETNDKGKLNKSIVNQIVKYIKEEPNVPNATNITTLKPLKLSRSKVIPAQSASSTLIRKAMADAHKSLTVKDEPIKRREVQDLKNKGKKEDSKKKPIDSVEIDDDNNEVEIISTDTLIQDDQESEDIESSKTEVESKESRLSEIPPDVEEYDPSQNMPQFVVTLTGLDRKLYPEEENELNESSNTENNQNFEEKIKPKVAEQCKYYPNCLAGDQCLYHHPITPCKMFPNCKFGSNCLYIHPKCKFDAACTRYDCPFLHTTPRMTAPVTARHVNTPTVISAQPCKFYYNCVNPVCPFQHPKICRYDRVCTNKNCTFQHTSLSHVNAFSKDKLKWSRPKTEEEVKAENAAIET